MKGSIPYGRQEINNDDIQAVIEILKADFLTQGPKVEEFETKFASYIGSKYAVAVANGTAALHLSTLAMGVKKDKKVITTPISFAATANCIEYCGGKIEFCDIDPETLCIDINQIQKKLSSSPKGTYQGIIPVDFAGYPYDMELLKKLADEFGLWIIEDSCHAPGGYYKDSKNIIQYCGNGNYANAAIFSFHPVKHIACGEGGMITTNDYETYQKLKLLRSHGIDKNPARLSEFPGPWFYEMKTLGYNYRLSDIHCALGISQLDRVDSNIKKRKEIAQKYIEAFKRSDIKIPESNYNKGHAFHLFIIKTEKRNELYKFLKEKKINSQVHYIPIHTMPYYKEKYGIQKFEKAERYYEHCLSIPIFPSLKENEQQYIIDSIISFYG